MAYTTPVCACVCVCFALFALSVFVAKMVCTLATDQTPPSVSRLSSALAYFPPRFCRHILIFTYPYSGQKLRLNCKGNTNVKLIPYINPSKKISVFFRVVDLFFQSELIYLKWQISHF